MTFSISSLTEVSELSLTQVDAGAADAARAHQMQLTKPPGSLGALEDLAVFMAGWQGREKPEINNAQALVFAGNHGVCAHQFVTFLDEWAGKLAKRQVIPFRIFRPVERFVQFDFLFFLDQLLAGHFAFVGGALQ